MCHTKAAHFPHWHTYLSFVVVVVAVVVFDWCVAQHTINPNASLFPPLLLDKTVRWIGNRMIILFCSTWIGLDWLDFNLIITPSVSICVCHCIMSFWMVLRMHQMMDWFESFPLLLFFVRISAMFGRKTKTHSYSMCCVEVKCVYPRVGHKRLLLNSMKNGDWSYKSITQDTAGL